MSRQAVQLLSLTEAVDELIRRLGTAALKPSTETGAGQPLVACSVRVAPFDILTWLEMQEASLKFYWQTRDRRYETAGLGATVILDQENCSIPGDLTKCIQDLPTSEEADQALFGGLRFDPRFPSDKNSKGWTKFGNGLFFLPRIRLTRSGKDYTLSCSAHRDELASSNINETSTHLRNLSFVDKASDASEPGEFTREDSPDKAGWKLIVDKALRSFENDPLKKVVLARETTLEFRHDLNPWHILRRLKEQSDSCYIFGFQPSDDIAFIGASPERLYYRKSGDIASEAIAGTRPRSLDETEDRALAEELMHSDKDRREHDLVSRTIADDLNDLCTEIDVEQRASILKQSRVQHLATNITGHLREQVTDGDLLTHLHPTPAVGGYPRDIATELIRELEGFDRGWYAGPIGWLSSSESEFAVGIRSGLVRGRTLTLYSGAGIVPGSTPEKEWEEIEQKMSGFLEAVTGRNR